MPTNRTRRDHPLRNPYITPVAIKIFAQMQACAAACTCPPDFDYAKDEQCPACLRARELERHLRKELRLKPWEATAEDPDAVCYPAGWRPGEDAFARWRALAEGVRRMREPPSAEA